jgi:hypothetical protein
VSCPVTGQICVLIVIRAFVASSLSWRELSLVICPVQCVSPLPLPNPEEANEGGRGVYQSIGPMERRSTGPHQQAPVKKSVP